MLTLHGLLFTAQNAGEHRNPVFCKREGKTAAAAVNG